MINCEGSSGAHVAASELSRRLQEAIKKIEAIDSDTVDKETTLELLRGIRKRAEQIIEADKNGLY